MKLKKSDTKYVGITSLLLILLAVSMILNSPQRTYKEVSKSMAGETLFTAIFFGDQNLGKVLPEFNVPASLAASPQRKILINTVLINAGSTEPDFFINFKRKLESGDPGEVDAAITNASIIVNKTLVSLKEKDEKKLSKYFAGAVIDMAVEHPLPTTSNNIILYPSYPGGLIVQPNIGPLPLIAQYNGRGQVNMANLQGIDKDKYVSYITTTLDAH